VDVLVKIVANRILMAKHFGKHQSTENEMDDNFIPLGCEVMRFGERLTAQRIITASNFKIEE
jgi:hypothetical protein